MAEPRLPPAPAPAWPLTGAWDGIVGPDRAESRPMSPGVVAERVEGLSLATVTAAPGRSRLRALGLDLPDEPRAVGADGTEAVWSGPGQWLLLSRRPDLLDALSVDLAGAAAVAGQTGGRAVLRLRGPRVRDVLAKGCPLDLHPAAFPPGAAAGTAIGHVGAQIWRSEEGDAFTLSVSRSFAGSIWSWLTESAAEFGLSVA